MIEWFIEFLNVLNVFSNTFIFLYNLFLGSKINIILIYIMKNIYLDL